VLSRPAREHADGREDPLVPPKLFSTSDKSTVDPHRSIYERTVTERVDPEAVREEAARFRDRLHVLRTSEAISGPGWLSTIVAASGVLARSWRSVECLI